ncbi:DNA-binding transcriptional LysR family regulator [Tamaricihabitans halophyticus]|uniref:DNA-binding transcriptional LysR family regulator n=1 Tax=Tamaricihabitans halophyticus TaxID=1262583 RepID=A0A4R2R605_9PSEU|nr:LysR family transcriptional regulator [Tamaricihabitans halophyticus]TCP57238.1 DNA-binding transcriptional LysR family regulator [Tamaricihabitans halophyticus]
MGVEIRHLRTFLVAVEERSISRAAERLRLAQPAVSRTLAQLEREVGAELLVRSAQGVVTTTAGARFRVKAAAAVLSFDDAVHSPMARLRPLRVGHHWAALGQHTTRLLRTWRERFPDVPLELRRLDDAFGALATGEVDIVVSRGQRPGPAYHHELLWHERRMAALPAHHQLADRDELRITELAEETVLVNTAYGTTNPELWPADTGPHATITVANTDDWQTNIAAGLGIGVTPESTSYMYSHTEITYIPLTDVAPVATYLAWAPNAQHPALADFRHTVNHIL